MIPYSINYKVKTLLVFIAVKACDEFDRLLVVNLIDGAMGTRKNIKDRIGRGVQWNYF